MAIPRPSRTSKTPARVSLRRVRCCTSVMLCLAVAASVLRGLQQVHQTLTHVQQSPGSESILPHDDVRTLTHLQQPPGSESKLPRDVQTLPHLQQSPGSESILTHDVQTFTHLQQSPGSESILPHDVRTLPHVQQSPASESILPHDVQTLMHLQQSPGSESKLSHDGQKNQTRMVEEMLEGKSQVAANPRRISLIVVFRGELGNQLSVLAGARMTQLLGLAATPPIHFELIGEFKNTEQLLRGRDDLVHCFPEFHSFNFNGGINDADFLPVQKLQQEWLSEEEQKKLMDVRDLSFLEELLERQAAGAGPNLPNSTVYTLPYLTATRFAPAEFAANEKLYHDIRQWFRFNESACCNLVPDSDEAVFHHRNFEAEWGRRAWGNSYTEVTPETVARDVFQNKFNDTRVAILSRNTQGMELYVEALKQEKGISARIVEGQSGVQDFCFILKARKEFFGARQSTFSRWASLLSNVTVVRLYTLDQRHDSIKFNSTTRKRITWRTRVLNRRFFREEYWQPDQHIVNATGNVTR